MAMRVRGVTNVLNNMTLKIRESMGDLEEITKKAARIVRDRAKENISGEHGHEKHIRSGDLRDSIEVKNVKKVGFAHYQAVIGSGLKYAIYVETCYDSTGGFLHPALLETEGKINDYIADVMTGKLDLQKTGGRFGQRFTIEWVDIFVF